MILSLKGPNLVDGLEHFLIFHILGIFIPIDLYFSEGLKPAISPGLSNAEI